MFRDPSFYRALREKVVPHLRTYPSLKVWIPGCATGEEVTSFAILLREEGLLDRTLIYATDINPEALHKAEAGIYALERIADFSKAYGEAGGRASLSDYYTAGYNAAVFDKYLRERVRPQPRHRQRLRRGSAHHLSQRSHLLRPRFARPGRGPVPRLALPQRLSRPGLARDAFFLDPRRGVLGIRARGEDLPEAMRVTR
jgi:hypothetical protein